MGTVHALDRKGGFGAGQVDLLRLLARIRDHARTGFREEVWERLSEGFRFVQGAFDDEGVEQILHAGDIGTAAIVSALEQIALATMKRFVPNVKMIHTPVEATGLGSCDAVVGSDVNPLRTSADAFSGTVCLGPVSDQAQVRGVYLYSPRDRIAGSTVAYPAAFPLGLPRTPVSDSGLVLYSTSAEAWRADGNVLTPASLGDPVAFTGKGYLLLGLRAEAVAERYRDEAAERGGPLMIVIAPTLPAPGLNPACQAYGSSVLIMPESSLDAVAVSASLCAQGEVNQAVLYPTVSIIGTHAGLWTRT